MTRYRIEDESFTDGVYHIACAIDARFGPGYDPGSGIRYENDVFVMNSFWDSKYEDCACDVVSRELQWEETHLHAESCYQSELVRRGFQREWWDRDDLEARRAADDKNRQVADQLAKEHGITTGTYVHCTCGRDIAWIEFQNSLTHTCGRDDPLFMHKATGLVVSWYKRIGRSTEANMDMKVLDWYRTVIECIESVRDDPREELD